MIVIVQISLSVLITTLTSASKFPTHVNGSSIIEPHELDRGVRPVSVEELSSRPVLSALVEFFHDKRHSSATSGEVRLLVPAVRSITVVATDNVVVVVYLYPFRQHLRWLNRPGDRLFGCL